MTESADIKPPVGKKARVRRTLVETEIHEQATRLFAERGYAGTNFQDIADAVGLTRPALYHYVKSKDELLAKLVAEITVVAASDIAAIADRDATATERIRAIVEMLVRQQGEQGERFRLLLRSEADLPDSVAESYNENRRSLLRSVTGVIDQGIARGEFRAVSPAVAAFGIIGMVNWVAWWYHSGSPYDLDTVCADLSDLAVHGIAAEEGRPSSSTPRDALNGVRRELDRLAGLLDEA